MFVNHTSIKLEENQNKTEGVKKKKNCAKVFLTTFSFRSPKLRRNNDQ